MTTDRTSLRGLTIELPPQPVQNVLNETRWQAGVMTFWPTNELEPAPASGIFPDFPSRIALS